MKTLKEFIKHYNSHGLGCNCGCEWRTLVAIKEFTKFHVNQALESASKKAELTNYEDTMDFYIKKESILSAYPDKNIK